MFCNEFCCSELIFAALLLSSAKLLKINETSCYGGGRIPPLLLKIGLIRFHSYALKPSVQFVGEYRFCLVGALETSAPPGRQPNFCECNLWEKIHSRKFCEFCVFCGRIIIARGSVDSARSVGEYTLQEACCGGGRIPPIR